MKRVFVFVSLVLLWAGSAAVAKTSEEWKTVCKEKHCQLFSEVKDDKDKILARVYLQNVVNADAKSKSDKQNKKGNGANLIAFANLPLGLFIPAGVTVDVDSKNEFKAQLLECNNGQGCRAAFEVKPKLLDLMKKGKTMSVVILDAQNKRKISFHFALADFEKAYQKFTAKM